MTSANRNQRRRSTVLGPIRWMAICAAIPLGCVGLAGLDGDYEVGDTSASGSGTGGSTSGTGGNTSSGGGTGGSTSSGNPPNLVNNGLIVRYFIDEAASGDWVTALEDSAPDPLPLALTYDAGNLSFTEIGGNRGLQWAAAQGSGRASTLVTNTKIQSALGGAGTATMELVVEVVDNGGHEARLSHIGGGTEAGFFGLTWDGTFVRYWMNGAYDVGVWNWGLPQAGRVVLHLVVNIQASASIDRVRLYSNGTPITPNTATIGPTPGTPFMAPSGKHYVLGNWEAGGMGFQGTLFYAAMYSSALNQNEVSQNAGELLVNDDGF
ncbi:MAG: hypothetical protein JRI68_20480 [Deltaproteobacteria bacterium]|nr:hypothetical protein [Deltaproteobacteria bacterium]